MPPQVKQNGFWLGRLQSARLLGRDPALVLKRLERIDAVTPALLRLTVPTASFVLLVKPQFEAGREEAARGKGVIRDPEVHARVLGEVASALEGLGAAIMGSVQSPLTGADGNVELLLHAIAPS